MERQTRREGWGEALRAWPVVRGGPQRTNGAFRLALPPKRGKKTSPLRFSAGKHLHAQRQVPFLAEFAIEGGPT